MDKEKEMDHVDPQELQEAIDVVLRFGGKIKRKNYTVYMVKDRLRIDFIVRDKEAN